MNHLHNQNHSLKHLVVLLGIGIFFVDASAQQIHHFTPQLLEAKYLGESLPLGDLPETVLANPFAREHFEVERDREHEKMRRKTTFQNAANALPKGVDPLVQPTRHPLAPLATLTAGVNVEGVSENIARVDPPDPTGEASESNFIQLVNGANNSYYKVLDKAGNTVRNAASMNPFWASFPNTKPGGDPLVLYDQAAHRWLLEEFADSSFMLAISTTADPLGTWYAYEFKTPDFPDYPKIGIWNDGYYITTNEDFDSIPIYILNRQEMLARANTVRIQRIGIPKFDPIGNNGLWEVATPANWTGQRPPPAGSPMPILRLYEDAWGKLGSGSGADRLEIWGIRTDWVNPRNTVAIQTNLPTAPFDSDILERIPAPTGCSIELQPVSQTLMNKISYRHFGTHESMVLNHLVDVDGNNRSGERWYELRRTNGGNWTIYQQGTISQDAVNHRFMGNIAQNSAGDIVMAYSISGPNLKPSLRITGRKANDVLGTMPIPELEFATGVGCPGVNRWGDYAQASVDPADSTTFWFTGQYMKSANTWTTRIASFKMSGGTNINPLDTSAQIQITPNPFVQFVEIKVINNYTLSNLTYEIINPLGQVLGTGELFSDGSTQRATINLPFADGMYLVRVHGEGISKTVKIVKQ
ncbi:MAG: hypothetical protein RLZZ628_2054 [Bacteroidota bacterium]|jgi:hypothetical protein